MASSSPNNYVFFHRPQNELGYFSQWSSPFFARLSSVHDVLSLPFTPSSSQDSISIISTTATDTDDDSSNNSSSSSCNDNDPLIEFACAEQYMMFSKALLFSDSSSAKLILSTTNPREHKRLGRLVDPFDADVWDAHRCNVVRAANVLKFGQNAGLRRKLLSTGDAELVEASAGDRVWGIGFSAANAVGREGEWGENLLGKALVEVRALLREEKEKEKGRGK